MESVLSPAMNDEKVLNTATDSAANTAVTAAVGTARISQIPVNDELISNVSIIGVPICTFSSYSIAISDSTCSNVPIRKVPISNVATSNIPISDISISNVPVSNVATGTSNILIRDVTVNYATSVSCNEENKSHSSLSIDRQKQDNNNRYDNNGDCDDINKVIENILHKNDENKPNLYEEKKLIKYEKSESCPNFDIDHHELTRISFKAKMDWWLSEIKNGNRYGCNYYLHEVCSFRE